MPPPPLPPSSPPRADFVIDGEEDLDGEPLDAAAVGIDGAPMDTGGQVDEIDGEPLDAEMETPPLGPPSSSASGMPLPSASIPGSSIAARLMAKMGWKEGQGLGKTEQGITTPLLHKKTDRRSGIIVSAPPQPPPKSQPQAQQIKSTKGIKGVAIPAETSRVLLLRNMVGPGEVDDDLEAEVAGECSKYGEVVRCLIYECVSGSVSPSEAVRIFVRFTRQEAALKAYIDLNGRYFGGRVVNASFFSEDRFDCHDLAPHPEELIPSTKNSSNVNDFNGGN
jgi:splicing factor 45